MDFNFDINTILNGVITKINAAYIAAWNRASQELLFKIIDNLGDASAKAQSLLSPITTGRKLLSSDHVLYILSNPTLHKNFGAVLGMLKVGRKHLFLINEAGQQVEVLALCVLDFYIHESQQRQGYGKKLFEFMLMEERVAPVHLAIDRPSQKFLAFLGKHYSLQRNIPQLNNFVIFSGYFDQNQNENNNLLKSYHQDVDSNSRTQSIGLQPLCSIKRDDHSPPSNNSVANIVFGKDISSFSRNLSNTRSSGSSVSLSSESVNSSRDFSQGSSLSPSTSFEDSSCTSPIKWHQHHTLRSSWSVLGIPPPAMPPSSR